MKREVSPAEEAVSGREPSNKDLLQAKEMEKVLRERLERTIKAHNARLRELGSEIINLKLWNLSGKKMCLHAIYRRIPKSGPVTPYATRLEKEADERAVQALELWQQGLSIKDIAARLGSSRSAVARYINYRGEKVVRNRCVQAVQERVAERMKPERDAFFAVLDEPTPEDTQ
jgi:AraC-like DNA-binding protein